MLRDKINQKLIDWNGHFVYAINAGEFTKVGMTGDFLSRMKQLQPNNPYEVEIFEVETVGSFADAESLESRLHDLLSDFHYRGEWFIIPPKVIYNIKSKGLRHWSDTHSMNRTNPEDSMQLIAQEIDNE